MNGMSKRLNWNISRNTIPKTKNGLSRFRDGADGLQAHSLNDLHAIALVGSMALTSPSYVLPLSICLVERHRYAERTMLVSLIEVVKSCSRLHFFGAISETFHQNGAIE